MDQYVATTLHGLEAVLAEELEALGAEGVTIQKRAVSFKAAEALMYKCNMALRSAIRILKPIHQFHISNQQEYYDRLEKYTWEDWMTTKHSFAIQATINSKIFDHSHFAALRAKDAIVDRFKRVKGDRPNVDTDQPDVLIVVHLYEKRVTLSIDTSGDALFKRGYGAVFYPASINESLAAGMLLMSGWKADRPFIDPMCGSGTFAIEAAMIATNKAPNVHRKHFGFMNLPEYDEGLYEMQRQRLIDQEQPSAVLIRAMDKSQRAIQVMQRRMEAAGVEDLIEVERRAFERNEAEPGSFLMMNPPYGERLSVEDIEAFYGEIGSRLKHHFTGCEVWMISSSMKGLKKVGLRPSQKHTLYNGALECKFLQFELYQGSKKASKN